MFRLFGTMLAFVLLLLAMVSGWHPLRSVKSILREPEPEDILESARQRNLRDYERARDLKRDAERWKTIHENLKSSTERWKTIYENLKAIARPRKTEETCRQQPDRIEGLSGQIVLGPASTCGQRSSP